MGPMGMGPMGMAAEIYDNQVCIPQAECDSPSFVAANGTPIYISGGDETGKDFVLEVPGGWIISGQITDADTGIPLADISLQLHDDEYNYYGETQTDELGNYYFSGLSDDSYRVIANGPPEGYERKLYQDVPCGGGCDYTSEGTPINVSGSDQPGHDMTLD